MEKVLEYLLQLGGVGVVVWLLMNLFLKPAIEKSLDHHYKKVEEAQKVEGVLVSKRYESAEKGVSELQELLNHIEADLENFTVSSPEDYLGALLERFHPIYRRRFQKIRCHFESANDVLSAYSLEFDHLLHQKNIAEFIVVRARLTKPRDIKYVYRRLWLLSLEGMRAVLRATSGYKFWMPHNYGQRAQAWAVRDRMRVEMFVLSLLDKNVKGDRIYFLLIEKEGADTAFWEEDLVAIQTENALLSVRNEARQDEQKLQSTKLSTAKTNPTADSMSGKPVSQNISRTDRVHTKTKVVLDTNVARELGDASRDPPFLLTFEAMAKANFVFHLADGAVAELLTQRFRGSIHDDVFNRMIERLGRILDTTVPVFLGSRDIRAYIGEDRESDGWTFKDFASLSQRTFTGLCEATAGPSQTESYMAIEEVLQEARNGWIGQFDQMLREFPLTPHDNELGGPTFGKFVRRLDETTKLPHPPISKRLDLGIRYAWRQHVRRNREDEPYKPESPKKRNDGIDFELYYFLMLPCLLVTSDSGFGKRLDPIKSFQRRWIFTPATLADAHQAGTLEAPTWPK
jgi:hypothetical protein